MRRLLYGAAALFVAAVCVTVAVVLPLRWVAPPTTAFMLRQPGGVEELAHEWRDRERIAVTVALAVIASEDQKFLQHNGLDAESIRAALEAYRAGESLRGASTISQQLAKNLYLSPARSFVRKGVEAYFTLLLELFLPKARILEIYLNVAEFGEGVFGVEAAAQRFFGASAAGLSAREAALLAAVLPSPKRFDAGRPSRYVRGRQRWILGQMQRLERERALAALGWR